MVIKRKEFPKGTILQEMFSWYDYIDSYCAELTDNERNIDLSEVSRLFIQASSPRWVEMLFAIRNSVVKIFGLKTSEDIPLNQQSDFESCKQGDRLGMFKVYDKTDNELILGEDDKHLNFRVSLLLQPLENSVKKELAITTVVKYNNWFGKLYFLPVQFFHGLIVSSLLKNIVKSLNCNEK
jgi:hypothetical protein